MKLKEAIKILASYETKIVYEITDKDKKAVKTILNYIKEESIPKAVVEEKIEELDKEEKDLQDSISEEEREEYSDANISFNLMDIEIRRQALQEILKESK